METPISDQAFAESLRIAGTDKITDHFMAVCRRLEEDRGKLIFALETLKIRIQPYPGDPGDNVGTNLINSALESVQSANASDQATARK